LKPLSHNEIESLLAAFRKKISNETPSEKKVVISDAERNFFKEERKEFLNIDQNLKPKNLNLDESLQSQDGPLQSWKITSNNSLTLLDKDN